MSGWLPGVILIVIGAVLFAIQWLHLDADVIVLVIGLVFVAAYAATRRYGLLIPAGILTGLGAGILLQDFAVTREPVVLGLGIGFLAIYGVEGATRRRARPLSPLSARRAGGPRPCTSYPARRLAPSTPRRAPGAPEALPAPASRSQHKRTTAPPPSKRR